MATTQPPFFRIPRELRDEIYNLTYNCADDIVKVTSFEQLVARERSDRTYRTVGAPPAVHVPRICPLEWMFVSKQFFDDASTAWIESHVFHFSDKSKGALLASPKIRSHLTKLSYQDSTTMPYWIGEYWRDLQQCCRLRKFRLLVTDHMFDVVKTRICCTDDLGPEDFKEVKLGGLLNVKTLQEIEVVAVQSRLVQSSQEDAKWVQNVLAFGMFLNDELKKRVDRIDSGTRFIMNGGSPEPSSGRLKPIMTSKPRPSTVTSSNKGNPENRMAILESAIADIQQRVVSIERSLTTAVPGNNAEMVGDGGEDTQRGDLASEIGVLCDIVARLELQAENSKTKMASIQHRVSLLEDELEC